MITLEPTALQKSYVTRFVQQRSVLEVVSSQLVILLTLYCF